MSSIYIENNHRINIVVEDPTTHKTVSDLTITGHLSANSTGSAAVGQFFTGPSSSFLELSSSLIVSQTFSESFAGSITSSFTESIRQEVTQSFTSSFSSSATGSIVLEVSLTETPLCSGQYEGIILGTDITTVFSSSFSSSVFNSFPITSASFLSESLVISASVTLSRHTTEVSHSHHVTQSNTASFEVPLVETADRCFGIFEIIQSGSFLKVATPMTLRSVRFIQGLN